MYAPKKAALSLTISCLQICSEHPIKARSLACCLASSLGNFISQRMKGPGVSKKGIMAYGIFGLLFGKTLPTYFHKLLDLIVPGTSNTASLKRLFLELGLFLPSYTFVQLYILSRLEGCDHKEAQTKSINSLKNVLREYYRWLSVLRFIKTSFVNDAWVLAVENAFDILWTIKLSELREQRQEPVRDG